MKSEENATGFQTSGFIDKKGTSNPDGQMPPGEDIGKQKNADINEMPLKQVTPMGYE